MALNNTINTLQIHLNSQNADKYNNGSNADVEFDLPLIESHNQCHIYLTVQHLSLPYSFYNCNDKNNLLRYMLGTTVYFLNITPGNYNINTLRSYLQSVMPGFTISYNNTTNKYLFTNNSSTFSFLGSSTCLSLLGFNDNITVHSDNSLNLISTKCIDLASIKAICVCSSFPTDNLVKAQNSDNNIIASFPLDVAPFSLITYKNYNQSYRFNTFTNIISSLVIKLVDQDGHLLDLNGCHWTMTLQLDIIDFVN